MYISSSLELPDPKKTNIKMDLEILDILKVRTDRQTDTHIIVGYRQSITIYLDG